MGWGTRSNFHRQSKLLRSEAPTNYPRQSGEFDSIIRGSLMLAAAIYKTKKIYRKMTPEELADLEAYVARAVTVKVDKKPSQVIIGDKKK